MEDQRVAIREAVGEYFGYSFNNYVYKAADGIADAIIEDGYSDASEIADNLVETYTSALFEQWAGLGAAGTAIDEGLVEPSGDAEAIMRADVYCQLYNAAMSALDAF